MLNPTELFLTLSPSAVLYPLPIRHERSSGSWLPKSLQSVVRGSSRRQGSPVWGSSGRHVVRKDQEACHMTQLTRILRSHGPSKIRTRIIRTTFSWLAFTFILRDNIGHIWSHYNHLLTSVYTLSRQTALLAIKTFSPVSKSEKIIALLLACIGFLFYELRCLVQLQFGWPHLSWEGCTWFNLAKLYGFTWDHLAKQF